MKKLAVFLFVLIACTGTAWSQTPDGETPAEESVCDGLEGDLFGLCNAYCEAMDCDSANALAAERACDRVLENFTAAGGEPPCAATAGCCEVHSTSGCEEAACEAEVCGFDPFCCDVFWGLNCVEAAEALCSACGGGDPAPI